ncbi:diaminohydroxyphosphoribosylaminopyrimidine deaminase/5-amino-6-(5-phosphoribosylamino)uracil reductase [Wenyingzhuangia heitensis]|uniref:Riboflavin biosynthesis protein RibD n=1 Tax=Wenyingzhuangia heitensis TaxID=1487859 RepID=A0ABX0U7Y0_9FLAO|nr:bifunctional diaminohydroxyphosphoribosylaminopyrimidine deaminase/5-amino-6-(5-phosphoribosylamino)uracil reductase RibD [Wenyingzhuangia heitensis]NIJ44953.1 diaminohydroxyphosphoribosylaminopyrimidine deaminase/5-amino-6-(5-phosphoribosylamino)uracil reductase [Wenyingzhuangia heitensis]
MDAMHLKYMQRAIALGHKGTRLSYPNPSVGAVIVCNDVIIGEGYTDAYGGPHAEVNAINSVKDESLLSKSTMYVTLEPCSHYGKTPPCANLIEAKKIPKIYIGCMDTFSKVSGKGIEILLKAGREVHVGILEEECLELHKRFLTFHNKQRPYVILKWAETKDGFIDKERIVDGIEDAKPTWISNELSQQKVHQIRAEEHAILVGTKTALKDNPSLTTRSVAGASPIRILVDRTLKVPQHYSLYSGEVKTFVFTEQNAVHENVVFKQIDFSKSILPQILAELHQENIQSVLVEGGKQLLTSFIEEDLWDEALVFVGKSQFTKGVTAPEIKLKPIKESYLQGDLLKHYISS